MEQATNSFTKGLQMDTNPMVQDNETLTDCLNGTLITMNGNEVILQNDMGNRRVDNAFLPSGYEPVGIKEYGGIIYVAAYNPITNKSQIGSFPSPERKINYLDDENLGGEFNFLQDFLSTQDSDGFNFIKTDVVLIPITGDLSLHAGDKFEIYTTDTMFSNVGENPTNWEKYITNFFNTNNNKIISPKNKLITLSVGILNSQNQFVDITKYLKRWDEQGNPIFYSDTVSEDYIFNDGYFISCRKIQNSSTYTKSDKELILERQIQPVNTYGYKLVGPMYMKAELNHIQEFSFNITGSAEKVMNQGIKKYKPEIRITATIIYNCPDNAQSDSGDYTRDIYNNYNCGQIVDWTPFDFYIKKNGSYTNVKDISGSTVTFNIDSPTYDISTNLYKTTATYTCKNFGNFEENELEYFIGVNSGISASNITYYLENLSTKGILDLSKLGSGESNLKSFRFYNNVKDAANTSITYVIDSYPKLDEICNNLRFKFTDVVTNKIYYYPDSTTSDLEVNNGRSIISFNWDEVRSSDESYIKEGTLYRIELLYDSTDTTKGTLGKNISLGIRWLLTTSLFNDCYYIQSKNFVEDYRQTVSNPENNGEITDSELAILYSKLQIDFKINYKNLSKGKYKENSPEGSLIQHRLSASADPINYINTKKYELNEQISDTYSIKNQDLYPEELSILNPQLTIDSGGAVNISFDDINIEVEQAGSGHSFDAASGEIKYNQTNFRNLVETNNIQSINNSITGNLIYRDIIYAEGINNKSIKNGFVILNSDETKSLLLSDNNISYTGFFVTNWDHDGPADEHHYAIVIDHSDLNIGLRGGGEVSRYARKYKSYDKEDWQRKDFNDADIIDQYEAMSYINSEKTFAFMYSSINRVGASDYDRVLAYVSDIWADGLSGTSGHSNGFSSQFCCKVWWRNTLGGWTLLNSQTGVFGDINKSNLIPYDKSSAQGHSDNYYKLYRQSTGAYPGYVYTNTKQQILNFLDPNQRIVFCLYNNTSLNQHNLYSISDINYIYNRQYKGDVIIKVGYSESNIKTSQNVNKELTNINNLSSIKSILPFYTGNIQDFNEGTKLSIHISSSESFEDNINKILNNDSLQNIYLDSGISQDINGDELSKSTIYRLENGKLKPLYGSPFQLYDFGEYYNSLICSKNTSNPSPLASRYLRANGDSDSNTVLEFSGGALKTVDYKSFQNL